MTATDELRRMLDERGVEYVLDEEYGMKYPPEQRITWSCDIAGEDMTVTARDYCIGINDDGSPEYCLELEFHEVFTPAQAVEATLGRDKCHVVSEIVNEYGYAPQTTDWTWELSCGHSITWDNLPDYCPWCGREVEQ